MKHEQKEEPDMAMVITQAEIIFCLAYYGSGMNQKELLAKIECMKYGLSMMDMLEKGHLEYDSKNKVWTLTEDGKKVANKLYGHTKI